ncbi:peptidase domain-containing protein [Methanoregula sp.]|jgi:hypothetical protein|uniref:peptidase domain-containing protein n=1 Tax=Methanoregula sp. TaxID=2052170 RepID=UPI003567FE2A
MSKRLGLLVMVVLLLCTSSVVVSAKELPASLSVNGGYTIVPAHGTGIIPLTVYNSITQGKTNWESKTVSSYITTLNVNLNWGNPSNSLQLTIYSPDGYVFGPYYDSSDGATDGRINLNIQNSNGIAEGTWYYKVYGYQVSGTQTYSI